MVIFLAVSLLFNFVFTIVVVKLMLLQREYQLYLDELLQENNRLRNKYFTLGNGDAKIN